MISEERVGYLVNKIFEALSQKKLVNFASDELARRLIRQAFHAWMNQEQALEEKVRKKIQSLKRNVPEGSPEWDVLSTKYYEEERSRRG